MLGSMFLSARLRGGSLASRSLFPRTFAQPASFVRAPTQLFGRLAFNIDRRSFAHTAKSLELRKDEPLLTTLVKPQTQSNDVAVTSVIKPQNQPPQPLDIHLHMNPVEAVQYNSAYAVARTDRSAPHIFMSSVLGGCFLGFAGMLMILVGGGSPGVMMANPGLWALSYALVFPTGLSMIIFTGADLYTGNTMTSSLMILGHRERGLRRSLAELGRLWGISFAGNLVGGLVLAAAATATLVATGPYAAFAASLAVKKCSLSWGVALTKGILANWMVNVGIFMASTSRSTAGKLAACWGPITLFVACGLEHSIANMFLIPFGILCGADLSIADFLLNNLVPVAIGNAIGGFLCAGTWEWYLTLGQQKPNAPKH